MKVRELLFEGKADYVVKTFGDKIAQAARADGDFMKKARRDLGKDATAEDIAALAVKELLQVDPKAEEVEALKPQHARLQQEITVLRAKAAAHTDKTQINQAAQDLATKEREFNRINQKVMSPPDKYLVWISRMYMTGQFKMEDIPRIRGEIITFERVKNELENKDLNSYKKLEDLYAATDKFGDKKEVAPKEEPEEEEKDVQWIIRSPYYKVLVPKSEAASCKYGAGTSWCTAATGTHNYYKSYADRGDLLIIMAKIGDETNDFKYGPNEGKWRKFQFQYESHSFMDETDTPRKKPHPDIKGLSKHPEHLQLLHMLVNKHLGPDSKK